MERTRFTKSVALLGIHERRLGMASVVVVRGALVAQVAVRGGAHLLPTSRAARIGLSLGLGTVGVWLKGIHAGGRRDLEK